MTEGAVKRWLLSFEGERWDDARSQALHTFSRREYEKILSGVDETCARVAAEFRVEHGILRYYPRKRERRVENTETIIEFRDGRCWKFVAGYWYEIRTVERRYSAEYGLIHVDGMFRWVRTRDYPITYFFKRETRTSTEREITKRRLSNREVENYFEGSSAKRRQRKLYRKLVLPKGAPCGRVPRVGTESRYSRCWDGWQGVKGVLRKGGAR